MQLLPGPPALALPAVAVWVAPRRGPAPAETAAGHSRSRRALTGRPALAMGASAVIVTLIVAGASLSRQGLGDLYPSRAQGELRSHPAAALADVNRTLGIHT